MSNQQIKTEQFQQLLRFRLLRTCLRRTKSSESGFTLTEILVVVIMVAVLFGIAAPGWFAFMNRQRISSAQTEVLQVLREAQKLAIIRRGSYNVQFDPNTADVELFVGDGTNNVTPLKTYTLGRRDGGEATVEIQTLPAAAPNAITFNFDGSVQEFGNGVAATTDGAIYKVVVSPSDSAEPRNCVVVDTILGSMREAGGADCDA